MTYHLALQFPDATQAAQVKAFITAQGGHVRSEFSRTRLEDLNDPRVIRGWRARVHGVPVYLAVGGPIIANLPGGSWVMASELHTTAEGKVYIRHDGADIPGCRGWSLAINFDTPRISDPVPVINTDTWPLDTTTSQEVINAMAAVGMMGSIPSKIFREMRQIRDEKSNRERPYVMLDSKLPLEKWGLRNRLERAKTALREAERKKAELAELERTEN